ncbi:M23 family metallopeptidase [Leifsonia sp. H3M29-4]|uniref:M23 family metallopeptidase n=1 Tax=Salinibacterium metalliresistens TaxID=3031321 RepID=UPI0023DB0D59|nr:M23 family metallopeptidase [Salinibacterium metalliresistens]MDF1480308.1 M23 family metallopeptidase [Salinibacterium metalliresistens]
MAIATLIALLPMSLVGVGLLVSPAVFAACLSSSSLVVGPIPESLTATTRAGETVTLDHQQLTHAARIVTVGAQTQGVGRAGVLVALMAALTESRLRMLANPSAVPESTDYPNDGAGNDRDSLGLFQMRPSAGWGTVAELMDADYQARAFYGGATGPNYPSPRGLLDIPGWQSLDPGEAAQAVEVSAYPDRYQNYQPVAEAILTALTRRAETAPGGTPLGGVPETSTLVFPLPNGTWVNTSDFGWRTDPFTGERAFHSGTDWAAADGTPILALADGVVSHAGLSSGYGGLIIIEHTIGGERIASAYAHMWESGILVSVGDRVVAGQHIGNVGSSGRSTGAHLHFEIRPGGTNSAAVDAEPWLEARGVQNLDAAGTAALCSAEGAA